MSLVPLGNHSRLMQFSSSKVCKLCSLQMESGSCLILRIFDRSRYLKCFKVSIKLGNTSNDDSLKSSTRKYLNFEMHVSSKDMDCSVWKIIV